MASTAPIRLTKPRLAGVILEATAATISIVLVLWLLIWFITRLGPKDRIEAYYVPASELGAPDEEEAFQSADVRRLRAAGPSDEEPKLRRVELGDEVVKKVRGGSGPVVIYVSAPVVDHGTKAGHPDPIADLIGRLAKESTRDVVLALDIAQVDSDRDLGIFGNSPFGRVEEAVQRVSGTTRGRLFVMTSAAAAQKSWSSEALRQSIFAYYLGEGLAEGAKGWGGAAPDEINVEGLYQYVSQHVRWWARTYRESVQTPMLLTAGSDDGAASTVRLRAVPRGGQASVQLTKAAPGDREDAPVATGAGSSPHEGKEKGKEKEKVNEKAAPAESSAETRPRTREDQLERLVGEWKLHQEIRDKQPYSEFPVLWKTYQDALLRAERILRIYWRDEPSVLDRRFGVALSSAQDWRSKLDQELRSRASDWKKFPFRPMKGARDGEKELAAALKVLKIEPPAWLDLPPTPAPADGKPAAKDKEGAPAGADSTPLALRAGPGVVTPPYLELQLPSWAYRFTQAFGCDGYFEDSGRAALLRSLVECRFDAELALHTDPRGMPWIEHLIEKGDRKRRALQDQLFGLPREASNDDRRSYRERVDEVQSDYGEALERISSYHQARGTFEQAACDLPYYGDWAIRGAAMEAARPQVHGGAASASTESHLPRSLEEALDRLGDLADTLKPPRAAGAADDPLADNRRINRMKDATRRLQESMGALDLEFRRASDQLAADDSLNWVRLDAALRVPLVPADRRREILHRLLSLPESGGDPTREKEEDPERDDARLDPGFWVRAVGFAQLDLALRRPGRPSDEEETDKDRIQNLLGEVQPAGKGGTRDALKSVRRINEAASKARAKVREQLQSASSNRDLYEAERLLREQDARVRGLIAVELEDRELPDVKKVVADYRTLGEYLCLNFHLRRLQEDYARIPALLTDEIKSRRARLSIPEPEPASVRAGRLKLALDPKDEPVKVGENFKAGFTVRLESPEDEAPGGGLPDGKAFVGLAGTPKGLKVESAPGLDVPGRLVQVPLNKGTWKDTFQLTQIDYAINPAPNKDRLQFNATAFYRGRDDLAAPIQIAVLPHREDNPFEVIIVEDHDRLRSRHPGYDFRTMKNQFELHPGKGYLRKGEDLYYELHLRNRLAVPATLTYRILVTEEGKQPPQEKKKENVTFEPGKTTLLTSGTIPATSVAGGRQPKLLVELALVESKKTIQALAVDFMEAQFDDYIEVLPDFNPNFDPKEPDRPIGPYFVIKVKRKSEDPVTEPINTEDLKCKITMLGRIHEFSARDAPNAKLWIEPDRGHEFFYSYGEAKPEVTWSVEVGKVSKGGKH